MRIYLDNCSFNRPFDDQGQIRIYLESQAKLFIQEKISIQELELVWSYILDFENNYNPFKERQNIIENWKRKAIIDISENKQILKNANSLINYGIRSKDALHVACAIEGKCEYFITTDDKVIKKLEDYKLIHVINPIIFVNLF